MISQLFNFVCDNYLPLGFLSVILSLFFMVALGDWSKVKKDLDDAKNDANPALPLLMVMVLICLFLVFEVLVFWLWPLYWFITIADVVRKTRKKLQEKRVAGSKVITYVCTKEGCCAVIPLRAKFCPRCGESKSSLNYNNQATLAH
jgi:hypothetical protein